MACPEDNLLLYRGRSWRARAYSRRIVNAVVAVTDPTLVREVHSWNDTLGYDCYREDERGR